MVGGSLEVKPAWDNMDRWKSRGGKSQGGEEKKWEDQRRERERRKKMQVREKIGKWEGRKVAIHCVFPMICGWGGSKSRLAKVAGAEPSGQMRDEKLHTIVARSTFGSKEAKKEPHVRTAFESWHLEKVHAVVARSQVKNWQVRSTFASCECTPLWREAHSQVKMCQKQ